MDDVLQIWTDLDKVTFLPFYPNSNQWSNTYSVEIKTVNPNGIPTADGERPAIIRLEQETHIFNANFQKQVLLDFDQKSQVKSQEWS